MSEEKGNGESSRQLDVLISAARTFVQDESYERAVDQLELALGADPASEEAREILASIQENLATRPKERQIELLLNEAETWLTRGETSQAQEIAAQILNIEPNHQATLDLLERSYGGGEDFSDGDVKSAYDREPIPLVEAELSEESERLIQRIDALLSRPKGLDPAVRAVQIDERIAAGDLRGARKLLSESLRLSPDSADLNAAKGRLEATDHQVAELLQNTRAKLAARDPESAAESLDEVARLVRDSPDVRELREEVRTCRKEQQLTAAVESARRLLTEDRPGEAEKRLVETEKALGSSQELTELRRQIDARKKQHREARSLLDEARQLYGTGRYDATLTALTKAELLHSSNAEIQELQGRARGALEQQKALTKAVTGHRPAPAAAPSSHRGLYLGLAALAVLVAVVLGTMSSREGGKGPSSEEPPPLPSGTGTIEVVLSSPGRTMLDNFELPEEGKVATTLHHYRGVPSGSHTVTIWRVGDSERKVWTVTVAPGKTVEIKE